MKLNFSIRQMLFGMIGVGILVTLLASAFRGGLIAYGVLMGCLLTVIPILGLATMYIVALMAFQMTSIFRPVGQSGKAPTPPVGSSTLPAPSQSSGVEQAEVIE